MFEMMTLGLFLNSLCTLCALWFYDFSAHCTTSHATTMSEYHGLSGK